jgi:RNA polymerase sigma-70 factor (sigma-E family)
VAATTKNIRTARRKEIRPVTRHASRNPGEPEPNGCEIWRMLTWLGQPFIVPRRVSDVHSAADRATFEQFVEGSSSRMLTLAMLLTGHNRADAEDLLQTVLERAFRRWHRICRTGDPGPYVRQMLVNASIDRWRLLRHRPEQPLESDDGMPVAGGLLGPDQSAAIADQDLLWRALAKLPPGQRAVLVLRYYEDMTEAQTAAMLGCSVGSVKTQASRALAKLRRIVGITDYGSQPPDEPKLTGHMSPRGC